MRRLLLLLLGIAACEARQPVPAWTPGPGSAAVRSTEVPDPAAAPPPSRAGPATANLYHLSDLYAPAIFNHAAHEARSSDCATCHHVAIPGDPTPSCRACHGATSKGPRNPSLEAAYHRQCIGCHKERGNGPVGCEACHARRAEARPVDRLALARETMPHRLEIAGHAFDHTGHASTVPDCARCHHAGLDVDPYARCAACHSGEGRAETALGALCEGCHPVKAEPPPPTPEKRPRPAASGPSVVRIGTLAATFPALSFQHARHARAAGRCASCHHHGAEGARPTSCASCHTASGDNGLAALKDAYHGQCIGCHKRQEKQEKQEKSSLPTGCMDCHGG